MIRLLSTESIFSNYFLTSFQVLLLWINILIAAFTFPAPTVEGPSGEDASASGTFITFQWARSSCSCREESSAIPLRLVKSNMAANSLLASELLATTF